MRGGVRDRGGTSLQPPFPTERLPAGNARLAGPEGARVVPQPWVTFPPAGTWAQALSQTPTGGTRRPTQGGAWRHGRGTVRRLPRAPRPVPGAVPGGLAPGAPPLSADSVALWSGKLISAAQ